MLLKTSTLYYNRNSRRRRKRGRGGGGGTPPCSCATSMNALRMRCCHTDKLWRGGFRYCYVCKVILALEYITAEVTVTTVARVWLETWTKGDCNFTAVPRKENLSSVVKIGSETFGWLHLARTFAVKLAQLTRTPKKMHGAYLIAFLPG